MKVLTISIASYNVEGYIREILDEIAKCNMREYIEALVIDDGGTDGTKDIAQKYEIEFPGIIRFIHKENGGWGSTVNTGIKEARGKYFKLLDGDDLIYSADLDQFVSFLKSIDTDFILSDFRTFEDGSDRTLNIFKCPETLLHGNIYSIKDVADIIYPRMHSSTFRTSLIMNENVMIQEKCFYTDVEYVMKSLLKVKSVAIYRGIVYNYRLARSGQSISLEGIRKHYKDHIKVIKEIFNIYRQISDRYDIIPIFKMRIIDLIETQYIMFFKLGIEKEKEVRTFERYLREDSPEFYDLVSRKVRVMRVFLRVGLYVFFVSIFNTIKFDAKI